MFKIEDVQSYQVFFYKKIKLLNRLLLKRFIFFVKFLTIYCKKTTDHILVKKYCWENARQSFGVMGGTSIHQSKKRKYRNMKSHGAVRLFMLCLDERTTKNVMSAEKCV